MSIAGELKQLADEIAQQLYSRLSALDQEEAEINARKAEIQAQRKSISGAPERSFNFRPQIGADYQCPRCWIEDETRAILSPIGGGTRQEDFFRCHICGLDLSFPA